MWNLADIPGLNSSRVQSTELELGSLKFSLHAMMSKLHDSIVPTTFHQSQLKCKYWYLKLDAIHSSSEVTLAMRADFGASFDLQAA